MTQIAQGTSTVGFSHDNANRAAGLTFLKFLRISNFSEFLIRLQGAPLLAPFEKWDPHRPASPE